MMLPYGGSSRSTRIDSQAVGPVGGNLWSLVSGAVASQNRRAPGRGAIKHLTN